MPRRPASGFTDDAGYPVAGGHVDRRGPAVDGHQVDGRYDDPAGRGPRPDRGSRPDNGAFAAYRAPADHGTPTYGSPAYGTPTYGVRPGGHDQRPAAPAPAPYAAEAGWYEDPRYEAPAPGDEPGYDGPELVAAGDDADGDDHEYGPREYGSHRRHRDGLSNGLKSGRDSLKGLMARKSAAPGRRPGGRISGPSRRTMTIAAVTTGTIAASTAAFAGVNPGGSGAAGSEASLVGSSSGGKTAPTLLNIAQTVADTEATSTAVSISPDHNNVAPNAPVMLTVRAVQAGGAPLANQPVRVVVAIGTDWKTTAVLRTDADGRATIPAHLLTTTKVSVVFDGTGALRPALASATTVNVIVPRQVTSGGSGSGGGGSSAADVGLTNAPGSTIGSKAVYLASLQKGKPYVWGATGPYSFDCSGLVQYVYKQLGRYLPRTAEAQYEATTRIAQSAKQPGDLIFFGSPGDIYHVAIYAGNGYIWQAPQTGETVQLVPIWSSSYYVGRVL